MSEPVKECLPNQIQSTKDVLFEHPAVEFKFSWEMILVTDGSRPMAVSKEWIPCLAFCSCDGPYIISIDMSFTLKMEAA
jgi:hypothetical protein